MTNQKRAKTSEINVLRFVPKREKKKGNKAVWNQIKINLILSGINFLCKCHYILSIFHSNIFPADSFKQRLEDSSWRYRIYYYLWRMSIFLFHRTNKRIAFVKNCHVSFGEYCRALTTKYNLHFQAVSDVEYHFHLIQAHFHKKGKKNRVFFKIIKHYILSIFTHSF